MKFLKYLLIAALSLMNLAVSAQDYTYYLDAAKKHLQNGNIEKAESAYNVYKQLTGKVNDTIEDLLSKSKQALDISTNKNSDILTIMVGNIEIDMMHIRGGTFKGRVPDLGVDCQRATAKEWTLYNLQVKDYYIAITEVTQELWQFVMKESFSDYLGKLPQTHTYLKGYNLEHGMGNQYPVYYVPEEEVKEFIMRLNSITGKNFRLPTTREWIYAEGGGSKSLGFKYSGSNNIERVAWYRGNSGGKVHPVASKLPNELGLYDFSGNVMEWTQCDYWGNTIYGSHYDCSAQGCQLQDNWRASGAFPHVGFRLALDY